MSVLHSAAKLFHESHHTLRHQVRSRSAVDRNSAVPTTFAVQTTGKAKQLHCARESQGATDLTTRRATPFIVWRNILPRTHVTQGAVIRIRGATTFLAVHIYKEDQHCSTALVYPRMRHVTPHIYCRTTPSIKSPIFELSRLFLTSVDHLRWRNRRASSFWAPSSLNLKRCL